MSLYQSVLRYLRGGLRLESTKARLFHSISALLLWAAAIPVLVQESVSLAAIYYDFRGFFEGVEPAKEEEEQAQYLRIIVESATVEKLLAHSKRRIFKSIATIIGVILVENYYQPFENSAASIQRHRALRRTAALALHCIQSLSS